MNTEPLPNIRHSLTERLLDLLPSDRVIRDPDQIAMLAADASFYQLMPKVIVDVIYAEEVEMILRLCSELNVGVTFRAAGTSLSGQAVGDGVLVRLARGFRRIEVLDNGLRIKLEPGVIGAHANRALKPYRRKIGPDPASLHSCMIGGIAANNASGMCCGTDQNTYQTLSSLKVVFAPDKKGAGPLRLDTASTKSTEDFKSKRGELLEEISRIRRDILNNSDLSSLIRRKYKIKNTMGFSLNSFLDYEDPFDILSHLMIGSEGTLGFLSEITYRTVPDPAFRSCSLVFFESLRKACEAASLLRAQSIAAAELMDFTSLQKVAGKPGLPSALSELSEGTAALLIETRADSAHILRANENQIAEALMRKIVFSSDPAVFEPWWEIRRGLFPSVGRGRPKGTTVIIEDVAFPIEELANGAEALVALLKEHGYNEAILFGHALDGNLHFVFAQDFNSPSEVERYARFMQALAPLVADRFSGSLKAEHGTGRNMAPFVEKEWGPDAYAVMRRVKNLFDPLGILNPGVLINDDRNVHLKALKKTPIVDDLIDECIECGFCEVQCPSRDLTVTPRQRIVSFRHLASQNRRNLGKGELHYQLEETCAADGLCATACPVSIDTGLYIKKYRARENGAVGVVAAKGIANNFAAVLNFVRGSLKLSELLPASLLSALAKLPRLKFLKWLPGANRSQSVLQATTEPEQIVYLPSCISRTFSSSKNDLDVRPLPTVMQSLFKKAKLQAITPPEIESLCCGLAFESKGAPIEADQKLRELEATLLRASDNGRLKIVSDTSPCSLRLKRKLDPRLTIQDSVEFLFDQTGAKPAVGERLNISQLSTPLPVHPTCSSVHMSLNAKLLSIAKACSSGAFIPVDVGCCGVAGDKIFTHPELSESALKALTSQVRGCSRGVSTSRTCEIGLSQVSGISYQSLAHLVDQQTK